MTREEAIEEWDDWEPENLADGLEEEFAIQEKLFPRAPKEYRRPVRRVNPTGSRPYGI